MGGEALMSGMASMMSRCISWVMHFSGDDFSGDAFLG